MLWDIFVRVIDNHGDLGVCWRLAAELAARGEAVRLWIDEPAGLAWMAPQRPERIEVRHWTPDAAMPEPGDVVVEAFGCDPPVAFAAALADATRRRGRQPPWINLEYLSAESYVERSHGLASPVLHGPATGLVKHFFYPGFSERTGGLLREQELSQRQATFDPEAWLGGLGLHLGPGRRVSLFCYEPPQLMELLRLWAAGPQPVQLFVTAGRASAAVEQAEQALALQDPAWNAARSLAMHRLPLLSQRDYDHLLWSCDFNFVRGEDSLVRALWAGRPFAWQIYPQQDAAHHDKLDAFLDWLQAPPDWRRFHQAWNGLGGQPLERPAVDAWAPAAVAARARALALPELATGLLRFTRDRGRI
jgi:uncharacterized repeat protein (TIGR03837 family)